jgi:hypothetical protein
LTESSRHRNYKEKLKYILTYNGWQNTTNEALRKVDTDGLNTHQFLPYGLDVYGEKDGVKLAIEVDNPKTGGGHRTQRERTKDKARTRSLYDQFGILVIRLEFWQIAGATDKELYEEIKHEIRRFDVWKSQFDTVI